MSSEVNRGGGSMFKKMCGTALLSLGLLAGAQHGACAFGPSEPTSGRLGFEDPGATGPTVGGSSARRARKYSKPRVAAAPPQSPASAQRSPREVVSGNSREALYTRCRSAIFQAYGRQHVYPDGRRVLLLNGDWLTGQVDACVANGGKPI